MPASWLPVSRPLPRRGTSWAVALCVLAACLGGLGAAAGLARVSHGQTVLVVARTVLQGAVIESGDLGLAEVDAPGVPVVPYDQIDSVVGQRALTTLVDGALVAPGTFGQPTLAPGQSQVTLRLGPAQVPSCPMPGGRAVWLLGVSRDGGEIPQLPAVVVYPPELLSDGTVLMDVAIASVDVAVLVPFLLSGSVTVLAVPAG